MPTRRAIISSVGTGSPLTACKPWWRCNGGNQKQSIRTLDVSICSYYLMRIILEMQHNARNSADSNFLRMVQYAGTTLPDPSSPSHSYFTSLRRSRRRASRCPNSGRYSPAAAPPARTPANCDRTNCFF
ncbi:hypothetical protein EVAR_33364_1 [Eumeta japonica]|uniref:Uncharacterized protein n=1 Tax=Eumeta variegata TaxID=151549 RepID=A0A4C1X0B7_EUMVA|nr:hypothetical protein EVAR_33364_1 [Eumeta japonica]